MQIAGASKAEAASSLRCSEKKVERLISTGVLDAQRIGRRVFVTRESIDRLLEPSVGSKLKATRP